jgi:hypothetical protein
MSGFASSAVRDAFLTALDAADSAATARLAQHIVGCSNPLPGMTCQALGLPLGSTYGNAAQHLLDGHAANRIKQTT